MSSRPPDQQLKNSNCICVDLTMRSWFMECMVLGSDRRSGSDWRSIIPNPNPIPNPSRSEPINFSFNSLLSFRSPIWTYNYPYGMQTQLRGDFRGWGETVGEVPRCLAMHTVVHHNGKLVCASVQYVQPMELTVKQSRNQHEKYSIKKILLLK